VSMLDHTLKSDVTARRLEVITEMLKQNDGIYSEADKFQAHMMADGNLVTGQNPASSKGVPAAVVNLLSRSSR
jgi:putative intracellular protease/amidase